MADDVSVLNGLIETTIDSADGYEQAAANAPDADLASLARRFASDRRQVVADLRREVVRLGGDPEDDGSLLAGAHRAFAELKTKISGSTRQAAIEEVERGEDFIKDKYERALERDLTAETRAAIQQAYSSIRAGHDTFRELKHAGERVQAASARI